MEDLTQVNDVLIILFLKPRRSPLEYNFRKSLPFDKLNNMEKE